MTVKDRFWAAPVRARLGLGAAAMLAIGAAGGAGAVSLARPAAVMAPTVTTPVARLATSAGVVTVRGQVAEVYGDRFIVQDATGRTMVDAGPGASTVERGRSILVQGRFDRGELHAAYLVDSAGRVDPVGPAGPPPHHHGGPGGPDHDGPPPPPQGCAPAGVPAPQPAPASDLPSGAATPR